MLKLDITLRQSNFLILLYFLLTGGSLVIIAYLPFFLWIKLLLMAILCGYTYWIIINQCVLRRVSRDKSGWKIYSKSGVHEVEIEGDSLIAPFVIVLRCIVQGQKKKQSYLLFSDAMTSEQYRQLVVNLRFNR